MRMVTAMRAQETITHNITSYYRFEEKGHCLLLVPGLPKLRGDGDFGALFKPDGLRFTY